MIIKEKEVKESKEMQLAVENKVNSELANIENEINLIKGNYEQQLKEINNDHNELL